MMMISIMLSMMRHRGAQLMNWICNHPFSLPCPARFSNIPASLTRSKLLFFILTLAIAKNGLAQCEDLSGEWQVSESVQITISIPGEPDEVIEQSGSGTILLSQTGCDISYSVDVLQTSIARTGSINGNSISLSGTAAIFQQGVTCSQNLMTATGTIINAGRIELTSSIDIRCTFQGITGTGTGQGTVVLTREVSIPPSITAQPVDEVVTEGQPSAFTCLSTGVPTPFVQWQRKALGSDVWQNLTDDATYSGTNQSHLAINNTTLAMSGNQFRCLATNIHGSTTSTVAILTVNPIPNSAPVFEIHPIDSRVKEGNTATFAGLVGANPQASFRWQRKPSGSEVWSDLFNSTTYTGAFSSQVTLSTTTLDMSGDQFRLVATNSEGSATSNPATLTIDPAPNSVPIIDSHPQHAPVYECGPVAFEITARGKPIPSYQWQRKVRGSDTWLDLADDETFGGSMTDRLTLSVVTHGMSEDQFRCSLSNTEGVVLSDSATLTVHKLLLSELKSTFTGTTIDLQIDLIRHGIHYRLHHGSDLETWAARNLTLEEVEAGVVEIDPLDYPPSTFFKLGVRGNGVRQGVALTDLGLIAYYPLDGSAEDASGNSNDGILNGPTETEGTFGNPSGAFYFDGVNDTINIGNQVKPLFPMSISVWVKPDSVDGVIFTNDIVDGNAFRHGIALQLFEGMPLARSFSGFSAAWTRYSMQPKGFAGIVRGEWTHIIAIMHDYNHVDWFINNEFYSGEKFGTGTGVGMTYSANGNGAIGASLPAGFYFQGALDELRIYDRALLAAPSE